MEARVPVLSGVAVYLVAMTLIGAWTARRTRSSDDFLVAGRNLPLWLCAATVTATWLGSGTVIGAAGAAYEGGLLAVIADPFGAALCVFLAGLFFVRTVRRMRLLTITDFFEIKYGVSAGLVASMALIVAYIGWTGAQLVAFGYILHTLTGISTTAGMVVAAVIVLIYTTAGGMWAVALTDLIQVGIIAVGLVITLVVVLGDVGGWGSIAPQLSPERFRMLPTERDAISWMNYARAWALLGLGSIASQDLLQRAFSSRDEKTAQNAFYVAGVAYLTIGLIPVVLGMVGSVTMPGLADPEFVVPELAAAHLHPIVLALFAGALLAAVMSSADSALLAPASLLSANVVPLLRPGLSERARLAWARYSVPVLGLVALCVALRAQTVYQLMLDAFSVTLAALFVPFAAGVWWRGANRFGGLASLMGGLVAWGLVSRLAPAWPADLMGAVVGVVLMVTVSLATRRADPPRPLRDRDGRMISMEGRVGFGGRR